MGVAMEALGMSEILALAVPSDLFPARMQMALSLGWHIVVACFGVGFPAMVVFAEWRSHPRGGKDSDKDMDALAHTWAKAMGVLFAVGAVSGTILSFEMGMLWPGLMARFGQIYGFPFTLEGFAFFIESIFVGVYLYGWNRLPPRIHLLSGLPMIAAGVAGAFFVVAANGWMNTPTGFEIRNGQVVNTDPWAAMFNPSTASQSVHMILAAVMVTGFGVASVYAVGMLRGRSDRYHRIGLLVPLTVAAVAAPIQIGVGDWIANVVAKYQPAKLAAMEGLYQSGTGMPLSMGGIYVDDRLVGAIEIPYGLSLLIHHDPNGFVAGLDRVPPGLRPPVNVTHLSYNVMVSIGFALLGLAAWLAWAWWRRRDIPRTPWFLRAVALSGLAAVVALEAGWVATEVGRQPWIVYEIQLTRDAVSTAPGLRFGFYLVLVVYIVLTVMTAYVLRRLTGAHEASIAPQEPELQEQRVGGGT
jgi:cytochrome bd ubiquinol oxidase subunit I